MKDNINISVIIPVKNRAHLLPETLSNILSQSKLPTEIIVVDDHSSDQLQQALKPFRNSIIYVSSKKHGPGAARNLGLSVATGNYIQYFDSDDLMTVNKFQVQSDLLNCSSAGFVYSPFIKAKFENNQWHQIDVIMQFHPLNNQLSFLENVLSGWCSITQACLFKRELIDAVGPWREDIVTHEDWDYWIKLAKHERKPLHTNLCAVIYRQHGNQLTSKTDQIKFTCNQIKVIEDLLSREKLIGVGFVAKLRLKAQLFRQTAFLHKLTNTALTLGRINRLMILIDRIINKWERILTDSDWERMHGVDNSKIRFVEFISMLECSKESVHSDSNPA